MKAIIMAGGSGTRLRPMTCGRPKPIVPVMNRPVMEYTIELLKKHGITNIGITLQYLPEMIRDIFGDGKDFGVNLEYFIEDIPLGTAGSVKNAEEFLDDTFVVISGDALTDVDLKSVINFHKKRKAIATLVLKEVDIPLEYGVVITNNEGRIIRFLEKPSWSEVFSNTVNTGIYVLEPEVLSYFRKGEVFDFSKDLFPLLLKKRKSLYGYVTQDYWCDIGDVQSYVQSHFDILNGKVRIKLKEKEIMKGVFVGSGAEIHPEAIIQGPVVIGENAKIGKGVKIEPYSVIGEDVIINNYCSIKRSIIWKNSIIGTKSHISGSVICHRVNIKPNVSIYEQAVIGDDTQIKERAVIKPSVKIWPHKIIDTGAEVNDDVIWGTKFSKVLFGKNGISGEVNVEVTPEFVSKLGSGFGSVLKVGSRISVSSDESNAAQMLKYSLISGLISSGMEVYDLGQTVTPIVRNVLSFLNLDGGVHIKTIPGLGSKVQIEFIDKNGISISRSVERKIENIFITGDFRRTEPGKLKNVSILKDYNYFYFQNLLNTVNPENIKKSNYKVILGETNHFVYFLMDHLCKELKCQLIYNPRFKETNLEELSDEVVNTNATFGMIVDSSGENLILVDDKGRIIKNDLYLALITIISLKMAITSSVVVPVTASNVMEALAVRYKTKVIRTKTAHQEIMETLNKERNEKTVNGYYMLNYDAFAAFVKILDFMASEKNKLSEIVDTIPEFYMSQKAIECPWEAKGKVMRSLIQEKSDSQLELYEGVKIFHDRGWVLVLPDADEPLCTVYSEGTTKEFAEFLSETYVDKIKDIINS